MKCMQSLLRVTVICAPVVVLYSFCNVPGNARATALISTSSGLDVSKVELVVFTRRELYDRFYIRALQRLSAAGLTPKERDPAHNENAPGLVLTLDPKVLKECPGKVLYTRKLEIKESVSTERQPRMRTWTTTWFNGMPEPLLTDPLTVEELEKDLDGLIDAFILDYKVANRAKNKPLEK